VKGNAHEKSTHKKYPSFWPATIREGTQFLRLEAGSKKGKHRCLQGEKEAHASGGTAKSEKAIRKGLPGSKCNWTGKVSEPDEAG